MTAAPNVVWEFLNDIPRVVPCMTGARLVATTGEDAFRMTIDVRLGAMALAFDADVVRLPLDDPCVLVLAARATERRGLGRAEGEMRIAVEGERTRTRVSITAELQLQGGVLQYSRGMLPEVAGQITRDFATAADRELAAA